MKQQKHAAAMTGVCAVALWVGACRAQSQAAGADVAAPVAARPEPQIAPAESAGERVKTEGDGAGRTFASDKLGINLAWPAGWAKRDTKEYELMLTPEAKMPGAELTLDVPDLPAHVPGMIPMAMVKNGYVDDLKKAHGAVTVKEETPKIDGAKARRVRVSWKKDGKEFQDTALLMVHGDRVYILRAASGAEDEAAVLPAFDEVVKSLKWGKK